jgi:hypothetical protein
MTEIVFRNLFWLKFVATLTLLRVVFEWQQQPLITLKHLNVLHSTATNEGFYTVTSSITLSQMASKRHKT